MTDRELIKKFDVLSTALEIEHSRSQQALGDFLQTDLELAFTFLNTAEITSKPEHTRSALEKVRRALQAIRKFAGRIEDPELGKAIHSRADELEVALATFTRASRTSD